MKFPKLILLACALALAIPAGAEEKSVTLAVKGWSCGGCASASRNALKRLDGVRDVAADFGKGEAVVCYDDARVGPGEMVKAVGKQGYRASVTAGPTSVSKGVEPKEPREGAPAVREQVSFFRVPLQCGAAEDLGCGSLSKPFLKVLERDSRVARARVNHAGTLLAVVWSDAASSPAGRATVERLFDARDLQASPLTGEEREKAAAAFGSGRWYGPAEVDTLSEREGQVIASRLVNRAKPRLRLSDAQLSQLTRDVAAVIAARLTAADGETCVDPREEMERQLVKTTKMSLSPAQIAALRQAADQGVRALPGEAR